jgi:hypothetical protein
VSFTWASTRTLLFSFWQLGRKVEVEDPKAYSSLSQVTSDRHFHSGQTFIGEDVRFGYDRQHVDS